MWTHLFKCENGTIAGMAWHGSMPFWSMYLQACPQALLEVWARARMTICAVSTVLLDIFLQGVIMAADNLSLSIGFNCHDLHTEMVGQDVANFTQDVEHQNHHIPWPRSWKPKTCQFSSSVFQVITIKLSVPVICVQLQWLFMRWYCWLSF